MDQLPFRAAHRTAAILAAFSRASDDPPWIVPADRGFDPPSRPGGLGAAASRPFQLARDLIARSWPERRRSPAGRGTPADPSLQEQPGTGARSVAPTLASHFDLDDHLRPDPEAHSQAA